MLAHARLPTPRATGRQRCATCRSRKQASGWYAWATCWSPRDVTGVARGRVDAPNARTASELRSSQRRDRLECSKRGGLKTRGSRRRALSSGARRRCRPLARGIGRRASTPRSASIADPAMMCGGRVGRAALESDSAALGGRGVGLQVDDLRSDTAASCRSASTSRPWALRRRHGQWRSVRAAETTPL